MITICPAPITPSLFIASAPAIGGVLLKDRLWMGLRRIRDVKFRVKD